MESETTTEMLAGHSMIYFAPDTWDGLWRTRQQISSMFARQNQVLFVEGQLGLRKMLAAFRRGELGPSDFFRPTLRQIDENLFVFRYPLWAPKTGRAPLKQLAEIARRLVFRRTLRKLQISRPIVWLHRPSMTDLIDDVPSPGLLLYHVVDEYTTYGSVTPARRRRIEAQEKRMISRVDAVLVVSDKLYESKRDLHPNTYLVPNGVNYEAYTAALKSDRTPEALQAIPRPRLGYVGLIASKIDLEMLREMAQQHPEWSLVFLGDVRVSKQPQVWEALMALPNTHYLGQVEGDRVPYYLKGFDVGLMPYVQNRHADYISPMKLYDYLAAGLPIASLDFPAARKFSPFVHLSDGPADFQEAVARALADNSVERFEARRRAAAGHSWEVRIEQLSQAIEEQLAAKVTRSDGP